MTGTAEGWQLMVRLPGRLVHMQLAEDAFGTAQDTENQELELALETSGEQAGRHPITRHAPTHPAFTVRLPSGRVHSQSSRLYVQLCRQGKQACIPF